MATARATPAKGPAKKAAPAKKTAAAKKAAPAKKTASRRASPPPAPAELVLDEDNLTPEDRQWRDEQLRLAGQPVPDGGEDSPAEGGELPADETDIEFHGRTLRIKLPSVEQLTIYRRLAVKFQQIGEQKDLDIEEALRQFDRAVKLITSVLVSKADHEWLEDELLERRLTLPDCGELLRQAFEAFRQKAEAEGNRADRRASKRAGKARLG